MKSNVKNSELKSVRRYLYEKGLKHSLKRHTIAELFFREDKHLSIEELYDKVKKIDPDISFSTVYRALRLFERAGLAVSRRFMDGITKFEPVHPKEHHDHLICVRCGKIIEFKSKKIEDLQKEIARAYKFELLNHRLELYGYCNKCRRGPVNRKP
ncbi:MAG: Fur family transcriptional regulator [candidate division WOR-3 bacterium]|nr:Fur family transcriptional regulator [candidate division WOR-3 bacterium]